MRHTRIVLSDDAELFLMLEKTVLNRKEFELLTARDGRAIIKIIREMEPDLVFMNLSMPEMDGDECCRIVKKDESICHIPVIMLIQDDNMEELEKCRRAGCDDILAKPIDRSIFMTTTRKFLKFIERTDQRFKSRLPINYNVMSQDFFSDYCLDLSTGGMFLETEHPLMVGTTLNIEFKLPTNRAVIQCRARGAWVNDPSQRNKTNLPPGMGVQFLDISLADMNAIRNYINNDNSDLYY